VKIRASLSRFAIVGTAATVAAALLAGPAAAADLSYFVAVKAQNGTTFDANGVTTDGAIATGTAHHFINTTMNTITINDGQLTNLSHIASSCRIVRLGLTSDVTTWTKINASRACGPMSAAFTVALSAPQTSQAPQIQVCNIGRLAPFAISGCGQPESL